MGEEEQQKNIDFSILKSLNPKKRRVFHPYFTSQPHSIVSEYIKSFTKEGDTVLDSFLGSGVTLLESRLLKRNSIGIDLSSFACFISKVSVTRYDNLNIISSEFERIKKSASHKIQSLYSNKSSSLDIKDLWKPKNVSLPSNSDVKNLYELFTERNFIALTILINEINNIKNKNTKELFRGIFSGILHRASRTFFYDKLNWGGGNSGIFTKYRYWVPKNPNEKNVWELFEVRYKRTLSTLQKTNSILPKEYEPIVYNESATSMKSVSSNSIDYIYIDPPYGGNINYLDLSTIWRAWLNLPLDIKDKKLEVIEGGDIKNTKEDYTNLLKESIKEIYRVLKENKYLSIAFSHKDLSYWYHIVNGCEDAGFEYVNTLYYPPYYNSYHKIKNPLTTLTGQMIMNFRKVNNPKRIKSNKEVINFEDYIINKIRDILQTKGDSKTEIVFNELLPSLLEKGMLKEKNTHADIIKLLEENFLYDSTKSTWTNKSSIIEKISDSLVLKKYDLIIFDFPNINSEYELNKIDGLIQKIDSLLDEKGTLWIIVDHKITSKKILPLPFIIGNKFSEKGFFVQNNIIWPHIDDKHFLFNNFYTQCIFLTKTQKDYNFNKDAIREKHIWKDVEWGNRKFRYNEKGKDPGNVWLPTEDDGKGNITKHMLLSRLDVYNRILLTSDDNTDVLLILDTKLSSDIIQKKKMKIDFVPYKKINDVTTKIGIVIKYSLDTSFNPKKIKHEIIFNTSENMKRVKDKSIKLIVTSPPYWDLKDYKITNQIGFKETYEEYLLRLEKVWKECKRVLKDEGSIWININSRKIKGKYYDIPYDFIESMNKIGLNLIEVIIWHKSSGIPVSSSNLTDRFEYILGFVKSNIQQININKIEYEDYKNDKLDKACLNMWNMNRISGSLAKGLPHPAMFPEELPERLIQCLTKEGDTVLDPFLGSGSTIVAAIGQKRNSVGYELNKDYKKVINSKINKARNGLLSYLHEIEYFED